MTQNEIVSVELEVPQVQAQYDIAEAVRGRRALARKYVMWLRRRNPGATPSQLIRILERHYSTAVGAAGAAITATTIGANVAITFIPIPGAMGSKKAGGFALKRVAKAAAKGMALRGARSGAERAVGMLPAGDQQLQFEITALFALALADIHGWELDRDQAHALVHGLSNGRITQQRIAALANGIVGTQPQDAVDVGWRIAAGRDDWSHWAGTLASAMPGGVAQDFVRSMRADELGAVQGALTGQQQAAVEYGVGALTSGVTRFVFGRQVVDATRAAFAAPPDEFPAHLALGSEMDEGDSGASGTNRALAALQGAAQSTGSAVAGASRAVGGGVTTAVKTVGGGVTTAAKTVGHGTAGAAKTVGGGVAGAAKAVGGGASKAAGAAGRGAAATARAAKSGASSVAGKIRRRESGQSNA